MTSRILALFILVFLSISGVLNPLHVKATEKDNQVILISFDGMANQLTRNFVRKDQLPNIKKVIENGAMAKYATTVTPSLTAPSHAAIATGATPLKTSIVSNVWREPDKALTNKQDGFLSKLEVEPLWVQAKKQGKTTATVAFAGANPKAGKQGDYTIYYGDTLAPSKEETFTFDYASGWKGAPESFSKPKESDFSITTEDGKDVSFHVLAVDTTNDKKVNYDRVLVSNDKEVSREDKPIDFGSMGSVGLTGKDHPPAGFWYRINPSDKQLKGEAKMYRSAVSSGLIDGPAGFSETITDRFGFFPPQDDDIALEKGWITRSEYEEISERFVKWVTDVSLFIKNQYKPDLLMFYAPHIDHEEHKYLLTDPRQPGYTKEKSKKYKGYIEWAYKVADRMVGQTAESLDSNDYLFIVSDHGMEPAHSLLAPNKVLKDNGYLVLDDKGKVDVKKSKAIAISSGSAAHVYINLKSREKTGVVPEEQYEEVRNDIIKAFKEVEVSKLQDGRMLAHSIKSMWNSLRNQELTLKGIWEMTKEIAGQLINVKEKPYEDIIKIKQAEKKKNKDKNAGDILLLGAPGYIMGNSADDIAVPANELGTHGGDPSREELKAVFIAMGPGIKKGSEIGEVSTLDIAPTIYNLLGLEIPAYVQGEDIFKRHNK
ncbi:hypothetical protein A8F94_13295 [Bacillus sp. FJAT-27225]|uniref:alkaline phosphatase family protein n=1 Tax=Bacillus sp. FJAT-27225 TaxID=1743144 RepID=UPI00080C2416|nr:alkaline phosphatase family protein [Bacillus sp. FJAT-27225]OCA85838.1 hypothetical protein A8F94_13295 [Bacillus sp. FJAT-27225]